MQASSYPGLNSSPTLIIDAENLGKNSRTRRWCEVCPRRGPMGRQEFAQIVQRGVAIDLRELLKALSLWRRLRFVSKADACSRRSAADRKKGPEGRARAFPVAGRYRRFGARSKHGITPSGWACRGCAPHITESRSHKLSTCTLTSSASHLPPTLF